MNSCWKGDLACPQPSELEDSINCQKVQAFATQGDVLVMGMSAGDRMASCNPHLPEEIDLDWGLSVGRLHLFAAVLAIVTVP
jgi:hypothetical protein